MTNNQYMSQEHYSKAAIVVEPMVLCAQFPFCFGNVLKYLFRAEHKGDKLNDLKKARRYLDEHIFNAADVALVVNKLSTDNTIIRLMRDSDNPYMQLLVSAPSSGVTNLQAILDYEIQELEAFNTGRHLL